MGCAVVVLRAARKSDRLARLQLIKDTLVETYTDAFLNFFFQELTLQCVVLAGAVLFIFCGVSVWGCLLLVPLAALIVWLAVRLNAANVANNAEVTLNSEDAGWVCELRGPLLLQPATVRAVRVIHEQHLTEDMLDEPVHKQVIGTVSVCGRRGSPADWWVSHAAVHAAFRRRGVGRALLGTVREAAISGGRIELHTAVSHLQPAARTLLHELGWECRGTYHRTLLGDALTLPMAQLTQDLPHA